MEQQVDRVSTFMVSRYATPSKLVQYHVLMRTGLKYHNYTKIRNYLQKSKTSWVMFDKDWYEYLY